MLTRYGKIFKILFKWRHRLTLLCSNVVKFFRQETVKSCVIYLIEQKIRSLSNCRYCSDHAQNLPGPAPNIWFIMFQISSKSVYFRRTYSRTRRGRAFGPQSICNIRFWANNKTLYCILKIDTIGVNICGKTSRHAPFPFSLLSP